jgi:hypothetical protein
MATNNDRVSQIQNRAYARWLDRDQKHGFDVEDWLAAEQQVDGLTALTESTTTDEPSSAPESGTTKDPTSGNQPARPNDRPAPLKKANSRKRRQDDPAAAGEER